MGVTFTAMCPCIQVELWYVRAVTLQEAFWVLVHHEHVALHLFDAVRVVTDDACKARLLQFIELRRREHTRVLVPEPETTIALLKLESGIHIHCGRNVLVWGMKYCTGLLHCGRNVLVWGMKYCTGLLHCGRNVFVWGMKYCTGLLHCGRNVLVWGMKYCTGLLHCGRNVLVWGMKYCTGLLHCGRNVLVWGMKYCTGLLHCGRNVFVWGMKYCTSESYLAYIYVTHLYKLTYM